MRIRFKYLIYPKVQVIMVAVYLIAILAFFSVVFLFMTSTLGDLMELAQSSNLSDDPVYIRFLNIQANSYIRNLVYATAIMIFVGSIFFVWFSHSLVGPIVGLTEYLKSIKEPLSTGQKIRLAQFRKTDYFQELAQQINEVIEIAQNGKSASASSEHDEAS